MKFQLQEADKSRAGVYVIRNSIDKRIYVGSSVNLYRRYTTHCQDLEAGTHHSKALQRFYNRYGKSKLSFEVLVFCAPDKTFRMEQKYLNKLQPFDKKGFNTQRIAYTSPTKRMLYRLRVWTKRSLYTAAACTLIWLSLKYENRIASAIEKENISVTNWSVPTP